MIYDKHKAWANGHLNVLDVPAAVRAALPGLGCRCTIWRGMAVIPSLPEHPEEAVERTLLELGFYFARRRQCWTHAGNRSGNSILIEARGPAVSGPVVIEDPAPVFDRSRIAAVLADSRAAAELIHNALAGGQL